MRVHVRVCIVCPGHLGSVCARDTCFCVHVGPRHLGLPPPTQGLRTPLTPLTCHDGAIALVTLGLPGAGHPLQDPRLWLGAQARQALGGIVGSWA